MQKKLNDQLIASDMLLTEKFVSSGYDTTVLEAANPEVRKVLQEIQQDEQEHAEAIFQAMQQRGWYNVQPANQ